MISPFISSLRVLAVVGVVATGAAKCEAPQRNIVFPVAGKVTYSDTFGAARSGGRAHDGQDLMGAKGTPLVAAADGTVSYLRYSSAGLSGNMLRITDAEGWQYVYIHINNDSPGTDDALNVYDQAFADGIRSGQKVKAGEPVGFLGDSGNAESTAPHLHFEIRNPAGEAINAYSSLRAAPRVSFTPDQIASAAPFGAVDLVESPATGTIRAAGWAIDRSGDVAVDVSLYVDGTPLVTSPAGLPRPDVAAAFPPASESHGFDVTATGVTAGTHTACVILHNAGTGGGSSRVGCATLTVG